MTGLIALTPIGVVRGGRTEIIEDHGAAVEAQLILDPAVLDPDATDGLSEFSHIQVAGVRGLRDAARCRVADIDTDQRRCGRRGCQAQAAAGQQHHGARQRGPRSDAHQARLGRRVLLRSIAIVLGNGKRLFREAGQARKLSLVTSQPPAAAG